MTNREKTVKELEWIVNLFGNYERHAMDDEEIQSLNDAIMLLKEQEPVKPIWLQPGTDNSMIKCGACLESIKCLYNYCPWCGRKVKLEWPLMNGSEISNPILMNCVC